MNKLKDVLILEDRAQHDVLMDFTKEVIRKIFSQQTAPFISGAASIALLNKAITSNFQGAQYFWAVGSSIFVFFISIVAYCYLSKIEKDKDSELLHMTKRIIEAVFKHFGVAMANKDAGVTAKEMNPIMQTVVHLVKEFQKLAEKGYKD
jgi:hypothetical protein